MLMNKQFSIVTIVKNRVRQLTNLIRSIEQSSVLPQELVVVWMGAPCSESLIKSDAFHIQHRFAVDETLPIPQARNKGFGSCSQDVIFYLDVDCICSKDLFAQFLQVVRPGVVVTSAIKYLPDTPDIADFSALESHALPDTDESVPYSSRRLDMVRDFTTTLFGICRQDYDTVHGFDEHYSGYGVGDIDFATRCHQHGFLLEQVPAAVLHQYHPYCDPPINHLFDIVSNATRYKEKWGSYPLKHFLEQFAEEGLIHPDYQTSGLRVRRLPTDEEIKSHIKLQPS